MIFLLYWDLWCILVVYFPTSREHRNIVQLRTRCECEAGWRSPAHPAHQDCSLPQELVCGDNQDNDQGLSSYFDGFDRDNIFSWSDGLVDCEDPECCWSESCGGSQYCSTVPNPVSVLQKSSAVVSPFASFFERYKFLVLPGSSQKFAKLKDFDPW